MAVLKGKKNHIFIFVKNNSGNSYPHVKKAVEGLPLRPLAFHWPGVQALLTAYFWFPTTNGSGHSFIPSEVACLLK